VGDTAVGMPDTAGMPDLAGAADIGVPVLAGAAAVGAGVDGDGAVGVGDSAGGGVGAGDRSGDGRLIGITLGGTTMTTSLPTTAIPIIFTRILKTDCVAAFRDLSDLCGQKPFNAKVAEELPQRTQRNTMRENTNLHLAAIRFS
jgi:hypothetical protein